jgi:hypothetical protein
MATKFFPLLMGHAEVRIDTKPPRKPKRGCRAR